MRKNIFFVFSVLILLCSCTGDPYERPKKELDPELEDILNGRLENIKANTNLYDTTRAILGVELNTEGFAIESAKWKIQQLDSICNGRPLKFLKAIIGLSPKSLDELLEETKESLATAGLKKLKPASNLESVFAENEEKPQFRGAFKTYPANSFTDGTKWSGYFWVVQDKYVLLSLNSCEMKNY